MRKSKLVVLFTALSITACITCLNGCGKQGVEPVMAATIETLTSEPAEEESVIATEEETESIEETTTYEIESVTVQDFTITEINLELQATQNAVTFETPSADTAVGGVKQDEIVKVTGIVDGTDWYRIIGSDNIESFIDSKYLKEIEQQQQQAQNTNQDDNNNNQQQQPKAETPKENPQPPVVNPPAPSGDTPVTDGDGDVQRLPDGGFVTADGTEVHPGDVIFGGTTIVTGGHDSSNWW